MRVTMGSKSEMVDSTPSSKERSLVSLPMALASAWSTEGPPAVPSRMWPARPKLLPFMRMPVSMCAMAKSCGLPSCRYDVSLLSPLMMTMSCLCGASGAKVVLSVKSFSPPCGVQSLSMTPLELKKTPKRSGGVASAARARRGNMASNSGNATAIPAAPRSSVRRCRRRLMASPARWGSRFGPVRVANGMLAFA